MPDKRLQRVTHWGWTSAIPTPSRTYAYSPDVVAKIVAYDREMTGRYVDAALDDYLTTGCLFRRAPDCLPRTNPRTDGIGRLPHVSLGLGTLRLYGVKPRKGHTVDLERAKRLIEKRQSARTRGGRWERMAKRAVYVARAPESETDLTAIEAALVRAVHHSKDGSRRDGYKPADSRMLLSLVVPDEADRIERERMNHQRASKARAARAAKRAAK